MKNKKADISQNNLFYEPGEKYQDNIIVKEPSVDNSTIEIISNVTSGFRDILFTAGNRNRIKSKLNQNTGPNQGKGDYKFFIDAFTEEKKETQSGGGAAARNLAEVEYDTFNLNFFTTCFKLVPIPSEIRSIFSHLDFHVAWKTISDNKAEGEVNRVMRFIKLYPEINVFSCGDLFSELNI